MVLAALATVSPALADCRAASDFDLRTRDIRWPHQYDPARAAQFSHNALLVHASCRRVFAVMADCTRWPEWLSLVKNVRIDGPARTLSLGATISLSIFGGPITARITEWAPYQRIAWIPKAVGPSGSDHYHAWRFVSLRGACRVVTEEVGVGPRDRASPARGSRQMHQAHDLWLASLRDRSELRPPTAAEE